MIARKTVGLRRIAGELRATTRRLADALLNGAPESERRAVAEQIFAIKAENAWSWYETPRKKCSQNYAPFCCPIPATKRGVYSCSRTFKGSGIPRGNRKTSVAWPGLLQQALVEPDHSTNPAVRLVVKMVRVKDALLQRLKYHFELRDGFDLNDLNRVENFTQAQVRALLNAIRNKMIFDPESSHAHT